MPVFSYSDRQDAVLHVKDLALGPVFERQDTLSVGQLYQMDPFSEDTLGDIWTGADFYARYFFINQ